MYMHMISQKEFHNSGVILIIKISTTLPHFNNILCYVKYLNMTTKLFTPYFTVIIRIIYSEN